MLKFLIPVRYLLLFIIYLIISTIAVLVVGSVIGDFLTKIEAANVHYFLETLGVQNFLMGNMIYIIEDKVSFVITWQCSGMFTMTLYTVLYFSFPKVKKRIHNWLFGLSTIYLANFLRVGISIYVFSKFGKNAFNIVHYSIGPLALFVLVVVLLGHTLLEALRSTNLQI